MTDFDFTGDFPTIPTDDDEPETDYRLEGYDSIVDRLMFTRGFSRDEAERIALDIVMDDAA